MTVNAYTRAVSPKLADCQLTHLQRQPIDADRAARQHEAYEAALCEAGVVLTRLDPLPDAPDGVFVEDTAVLLGEHAVIMRPGSPERAVETQSTASALSGSFMLHELSEGKLDGGDVLKIGRRLYVGLSKRTDRAGAEALRTVAAQLGYEAVPIPVGGCLHLKTGVSFAGPDADGRPLVLINRDWVDPAMLCVEPLTVSPEEPFAANVLRVGDRLIIAAGAPRTRDTLAARGFDIVEVDISELQKAEAGLTCMSLVVESRNDP